MCSIPGNKLSVYDNVYKYQTQKRIQNTVRVPSSLYTMNLGSLVTYQSPLDMLKVNWNQMSDRRDPHIQVAQASGNFYHGSSLKHSQNRGRPGTGTPGGIGVDVKHNSYYRYLNRLKANKLKHGIIPPTFGEPILFNRAFPIYGDKTVKTSIINDCKCSNANLGLISDTAFSSAARNPEIGGGLKTYYKVGEFVYVRNTENDPFDIVSLILDISDGVYTVKKCTVEYIGCFVYINDNGETFETVYQNMIPYVTGQVCNLTWDEVDQTENHIIDNKLINNCDLLNEITGPNAVSYILSMFSHL